MREPTIQGAPRDDEPAPEKPAELRTSRPRRREASPAAALGSDRPAGRRRAAGDQPGGRAEAGRAAAPYPLRRPARPGQDHVRDRAAQRAGRRAQHHERGSARQEDGRHALPDQRGRGLDPLHRRDPSPAPRRRGIHLPGDGRFPGRRRSGRRNVGTDHQPPAQEIHDHRRHHSQRHALGAAARTLRHARASRVLRRRRPDQDHHDQRRQAPLDHRPRSRERAGRAQPGNAPHRQRPPALGARLRPGPRRRNRSTWRSRAMPWPCRRSTPRGSTSKTGATSKR